MKVLFVCKGNVGRSQMAGAFFNSLSRKNHAASAGTSVFEKEGGSLHDYITASMKDAGLDISRKRRMQLTPEMVKEADMVFVLMEAHEMKDLPDFLASQKTSYWPVKDGKGQDYQFHLRMRDRIKSLVEQLVEEIG